MPRKQAKGSLADRIAGVLSAVPAQFNPDDDHIDDTNAKLTDFDDVDEENDDDEELLSKFRKQNINLLADVDSRYAGKKGSRKSLQTESSDDEESENEDSDDNDGSESDSNDDDGSNENKAEMDDDDEEKSEGDSEEERTGSEDDDGSEESGNEGSVALSEEGDSNFQHMRESNLSEQVQKGHCVRNQMNLWENLLEVRIQLQKCLVAANKMPQGNYYKQLVKESSTESNFKKKVGETKNSISNVLDKLLTLQNLVIKKYPETKSLGKKGKEMKKDEESDEEIPSDTDEEIEQNPSDLEEESKLESPKRRKLNDYENAISEIHEKYRNYRNDTIEKWNTKTRLSVTKNAGQTHSVVKHIEHILTDKEKLRKRTQLKRSEYKILGQEDDQTEKLQSNEDIGDIKQAEEYNTEIFDDNDFYHQLLRELIEVKSTDITDPVQLSRQWIQLQNLRSKLKRKIDTKATKGRKIRYAVHKKLVNFMAPLDTQTWTEEAKNELFGSLFGKIQPKSV